jgi:hypothetical protein
MTSPIFFFQKHTYILTYLKKAKEKNLISCLNRDDCEFLIICTFFYKLVYNFLTEKDSKFFYLQNLFIKMISF